MKYIIAAAIVLVLVGAPLGSYLYLRKGFEYRLNALEELKPKTMEASLKTLMDSMVPDNNKVSLVYMKRQGDDLGESQLDAIDAKVVDTASFQTIIVDRNFRDGLMPEQDMQTFYLLDTAGVLRATYSANEQTLKDIIRHLSVLIPMPKRKNIQLKRDVEG